MKATVIQLATTDNVVVCCRNIAAGETIAVAGEELIVSVEVPLGHKLALVRLQLGDKIIKYGMAIGSMTTSARPGDWVHMHNMKSDYMPAHLRDAVGDEVR